MLFSAIAQTVERARAAAVAREAAVAKLAPITIFTPADIRDYWEAATQCGYGGDVIEQNVLSVTRMPLEPWAARKLLFEALHVI